MQKRLISMAVAAVLGGALALGCSSSNQGEMSARNGSSDNSTEPGGTWNTPDYGNNNAPNYNNAGTAGYGSKSNDGWNNPSNPGGTGNAGGNPPATDPSCETGCMNGNGTACETPTTQP